MVMIILTNGQIAILIFSMFCLRLYSSSFTLLSFSICSAFHFGMRLLVIWWLVNFYQMPYGQAGYNQSFMQQQQQMSGGPQQQQQQQQQLPPGSSPQPTSSQAQPIGQQQQQLPQQPNTPNSQPPQQPSPSPQQQQQNLSPQSNSSSKQASQVWLLFFVVLKWNKKAFQ